MRMHLEAHHALPSSDRLLLEELTHRVKNELTVAIGTVAIAARRTDVEQFGATLAEIQRRLENLASVIHLMQQPRLRTRVDACAYLRQLCQAIGAFRLQSRGLEIVFVERPLRIDSDQCWRLGMIISELVSNAGAHAFSERSGRIRVEASDQGSMVECRVEDNGTYALNTGGGSGIRLITALANELRGRLNQQFSAFGSVSTLIFPKL
jgi:two-component sensor histidine kinase